MAESFLTRLKHSWELFSKKEVGNQLDYRPNDLLNYGASFGIRPDRIQMRKVNDKSIISAIYTRMGIDVADVPLQHVEIDQNGRYLKDILSGLHECLTVEANIDQSARAFQQDAVMSMFDQGVIAIVPVETTTDPTSSNSYEIKSLRVGEVTQWFPKHVEVNLYNEAVGLRQKIVLPKKMVAIVENPLYAVMNEPNSTLQRLLRKLALLDSVDEQASSGKLDIIIQLPYVIKSESRRNQAEQRRSDIEMQLKGSKYGIAYTDGTEKITQLNRPAENNMLKQVEFLTNQLYVQLGLTPEIFNGTADEKAMVNYHNRTIGPILTAFSQEIKRKFLTKTARTRGQSIEFFRDPFKLVGVAELAELADKFTRNEIMTSNEFRGVMGMRPADDPKANELRNSNMPQPPSDVLEEAPLELEEGADSEANALESMDKALDDLLKEIDGAAEDE